MSSSALVTYNETNTSPSPHHEENSPKEIALDSLPYIDNLHPDYEAYALTLIEEEMQKMIDQNDNDSPLPSDEDRLRHLLNPLGINGNSDTTPDFKSSRLNGNSINIVEYESLVERQGQPRTDMTDYSTIIRPTKLPDDNDNLKDWKDALQKAKAELEYERLRMVNIELQSEFETPLWQHQTKRLEILSNHVKDRLSQQQRNVDEINAKRQYMQTENAAPKLNVLSRKWDESLNRVTLLADGIEKLSREVEGLRQVTGASFQNEDMAQDDDDDDDL